MQTLLPNEHRTTRRQRVLLTGKLVYGTADLTLDCVIRDLSDAGARIRVTGPTPLPSRLHLIEVKSARAFDCEIAWRRMPDIGLKFVGPALDLDGNQARELWMLRRVWLEASHRYAVPEGMSRPV